jgi:PadR family transcriptional regulator, regulatory protein PadR
LVCPGGGWLFDLGGSSGSIGVGGFYGGDDAAVAMPDRVPRFWRVRFSEFIFQNTPCASTYCGVYVEVIGMSTSSKFELPQGTLDLLILRVVGFGPIHGYAIAQRIQMVSKEALQVQQGSLYPALHRLENKKFLVAEWGPTETGREAKFYRLTEKGRTQLQTETESWERLTEVVAMILQHPLGEPS